MIYVVMISGRDPGRRYEMGTAKEEVLRMVARLPDESSFEDIQYHIYVREKVERGLRDVEEGRVLSQDEVERRMARWLEP